MSINEEFMRLNYYKQPKEFVLENIQTVPWAYDVSYNIFDTPEVTDYEAVGMSITNIILTLFGQYLFELGIGSSIAGAVFENFENPSYAENVLDTVLVEIQEQETRVDIDKRRSNLLIDFDNNSIEFVISYTVNETGLKSVYNKKIII
jgi:phage baseplate assembly protein W